MIEITQRFEFVAAGSHFKIMVLIIDNLPYFLLFSPRQVVSENEDRVSLSS